MNHVLVQNAPLDFEAAETFAGRVGEIVNSGAIAVMMSVGHKTGLFDIMETLPPSSSHEVAEAAGFAERYVREWLAVMVTGGIVEYDAGARTYHLPAEHAACLTRGAELGNIAVYAQFVPMVGSTQDRIIECFRSGEGTRYEDYPCFHAIMAEDSEQTVVAQLVDTILPLVPGMRERLTRGIDVLDAGCGSGRALVALAAAFPASRFTGYDLCSDAIASARETAKTAGVGNVTFEVRDLTGFDEKARYDFVTSFDAIHDQKDPQGLLNGIFGALRPGGAYLVQDIGGSASLENNIDFPFAAFLYTASCTHCTPISLGQGGPGLGTMWGWETAEAMLGQAGFEKVDRHVFDHDPMNVWFVAQKP